MNDIEILLNAPEDPGQLEAYLADACKGDSALRARVDALLEAQRRSDSFMEETALEVDQALAKRLSTEVEGSAIGKYKLLEIIGEGGFGVVYLAEQLKPVKRKVAIKIIKPGMDTKQVVARFESERQALAMMDHPNIARVHDAGSTNTGRSFFVMDLVRGISITQFCDEHNLNTKERLELHIDVCRAVQHAHQKGVIHRDLKPSNILVTLQDNKALPKVIDFGVAKATQTNSTFGAFDTRSEQLIGTPAYMSPEQAQPGLDIDTRSDIYSLGVILYELLIGRPAFDPRELAKAGNDEIRRVIREDEPPKPSTSLTKLTDAELTDLAKHRKSAPEKLIHFIRGDLDRIVMKALEKDRTRRYETVNALAEDLRRHLNDEPVTAGEPSVAYRLRKYVRRNRTVIGVAATITAILVVGTVVSSWMAFAAHQANTALKKTRDKLELEVTEKEAARQAAARSDRISAFREVEGSAFDGGQGLGMARLARYTREDPFDTVSAERLMAALMQREFSLPEKPPFNIAPTGLFASGGKLSPDGLLIVTWNDVQKTVSVLDIETGKPVGPLIQTPVYVFRVQFSPDQRFLLTDEGIDRNSPGTMRLWNWKNGENIWSVELASRHLYSQFSPDGTKILSDTWNERPSIRSTKTGNLMLRLKTESSVGDSLRGAWSADGQYVATGSWDRSGSVFVWDAHSGRRITGPMKHLNGETVLSVTFNPEGNRLLSTAEDRTARVWDVDTGTQIGKTMWHDDVVNGAEFSRDGSLVVTRSKDRTARVWEAESGLPVTEPLRHRGAVRSATFHPTGDSILTGDMSGVAQRWSIATSQPLGAPLHHQRPVYVSFSANGHRILTSSPGEVQIWPTRAGQPRSQNLRQPGFLYSISPSFSLSAEFSPDGQYLLTGANWGNFGCWNSRSGELIHKIPLESTSPEAAWNQDGTVFLTTTKNHGLKIFDSKSGKTICEPSSLKNKYVRRGTFSADGKVAAVCVSERACRVVDSRLGHELCEPLRHDAAVTWCAFDPDVKFLVTTSTDGIAKIWDTTTWQCLQALHDSSAGIANALFNHDGTKLVTSSTDGLARLWNVLTGDLERKFSHLNEVNYAEFSPNGERVVTASIDATARVWDVATGHPVGEIMRHEKEIIRARFSPDGRRVVTASYDGTARIWDATTGFPLSGFLRHDGQIHNANFSPDPGGTRIATVGLDMAARIWHLPPVPVGRVPDWVPVWAELVIGIQLDEQGVIHPLPTNLESIRAAMPDTSDKGYYKRVAEWFCQDPEVRPISPFSDLTLDQYVVNRIRENNKLSLEEALRVAPSNPVALGRYAVILRTLSELKPDDTNLPVRVRFLSRTAEPRLRNLLSADPDHVAAWVTLLELAPEEENFTGAHQAFLRASIHLSEIGTGDRMEMDSLVTLFRDHQRLDEAQSMQEWLKN